MEALTEAAPAKVNLALHVTGRRADGYHLLDSLVVFAGVGDELAARPAATDRLAVTGPFARDLGTGPANLVMRAVAAFRSRWPGHVATGLDLTLTKNLPVAAGLGGGSADAAAALRLLSGLGPEPVPHRALLALGAELGADVPVCLISRPARLEGIGEFVTPLPSFPRLHLVLVNPQLPLPTPEVFKRLEQRHNPPLPDLPDPLTRPAQLGVWLGETRNDLEPPAIGIIPAIGTLIERLGRTQGCMLARMSGSGATVFGLYGSGAQAHQAAHDLRAAAPDLWVAAAPVLGV